MKTLNKAIVGTLAAGAMVVSMATPAAAEHREDGDGIGAGEVIAGAVVLGGLAAILASTSNNRYDRDYRYSDRNYRGRDYRDRDYRGGRGDYRYGGYDYRSGGARNAVDVCVRTAERQARRYTGSRADVYEIRDVDRERGGYEVKGRIAVRDHHGRWNRGYSRNGNWDEGRFTCDVRHGRVVDLDFSGIRRL